MALKGKLVGYIEISSDIKALHGIWIHTAHDIPSVCPDKVHACDLISGQRGVAGSIINWDYTHEGKRKYCKQIIESVDNTNHTTVYKCIGGELVEIYKAFTITFHTEPKDGKQLVVWTMEFERENTSVPYPTSLMDYNCGLLLELDAHLKSK